MSEAIVAVVVTYNRKALLVECLAAVLRQTHAVKRVVVIDNASTDGTTEHLESLGFLSDDRICYLRMPTNQGGASGFSMGIAKASESADWIWVMDDDCIPHEDALFNLQSATGIAPKVGFVCSHVRWRDGSPHRMNLPVVRNLVQGKPFNLAIEQHCLLIQSCSFVSALISTQAVQDKGLPLADFFIWGDDVEYFSRLSKGGWLGLYAYHSVVLHKTEKNTNDDLFIAQPSEMWKHFYGIRNQLFLIRVRQGWFAFFGAVFNKIIIYNFKLARRKDDKLRAILINTKGVMASLIFYPKK